MSIQVKSKKRVTDHGEVFTAEREVNAMLDLVKQETERIDSRFLEPACGNGNFLAEILRRKLAVVKRKYKKSPIDYEKYAVLAATSIYGVDFIRYNNAVVILKKILKHKEKTFDNLVSPRKPFGFPTNYSGKQKSAINTIGLFERGKISFIPLTEILRNHDWVHKYKIYISKAYNAGDNYPHQIINKPILAEPNTSCTETYVVIGPFDSKEITENVISYIETRFFRFLVFLRKISQDATSKVYSYVPVQDFSKPWTDEELYEKYGLDDEEIAFIESMIRPMEVNGGIDGE